MAQVALNAPVNFATAQTWYGNYTGVTATRITITDGYNTGIYSGQFTYPTSPTNDVAGVLQGYTEYSGATLKYAVSGLSVDAHLANFYISHNNVQGLLEVALIGNDSIVGSAGADVIIAYAGNDQIRGGAGNDTVDGGLGTDTLLYSNAASKYEIVATGPSLTVRDRTGVDGTDTLSNVEILTFSNISIDAASVVKTATLTKSQIDNLTEVYIASFNRAPDALGLDYWGGRLKDGMGLDAIAKSFFSQAETATKYPGTMTNENFVTTVYGNVLGRTPDAAGLKFWVGQLDGGASRDSFLLAILNGAHANPGATLDIAYLNNKVAVGEHFALAKGLTNGTLSQVVMAGVTSNAATVTAANAMTDNYAAAAETAPTAELVVKILGIVA